MPRPEQVYANIGKCASSFAVCESARAAHSTDNFKNSTFALFESSSLSPQREVAEPRRPLLKRLSEFATLSRSDLIALDDLYRNPRTYPAEHILAHEQSRPTCAFFLGSGLAYRYRILNGGRRQILGYMAPGDLFDLHSLTAERFDHNIALLTDAAVFSVPSAALRKLVIDFPSIGRALSLASIVETSILREWLVNLGQRNALQRVSHFLVEMATRLESVGMIEGDGSFDFPFSQMTLADTTGMTIVHANRTLQKMRAEGLIKLSGKRLMIIDRYRLSLLAGFEGDYLRINYPDS